MIRLIALSLSLAALVNTLNAENLSGSKPNIVLVLVDDTSFNTVSAYGGEYPSPNTDKLYEKGVHFTDFHVSPTCSPTRSAIMTGRHECYAGVTHTVRMRERLNIKSRTIANMFNDAGYTAGIFGKWHLGDEAAYRPDQRGFDEALIHGSGGIGQNFPHSADFPYNNYHDPVLYHNGKVVETQGYCTDIFFDYAIKWMGQQKEANKHFFCYIPLNVAHSPMIPPNLPDGDRKDILTNLDNNVGKLTAFLEESNLIENTLVIYMTDNGPIPSWRGKNAVFKGTKGDVYEGGIRVPFIIYWKGHIEGGLECDRLAGHIDLYPTFAELVGSNDPVPGDKPWDGRSILSLFENPKAEWPQRTWISHRTRWGPAEESKYSNAAIRHGDHKLVFDTETEFHLFNLADDPGESKDIASSMPETVEQLKATYESWWQDIQPYLVNDQLADLPKESKPYHELYREQLGQEKYDAAMKAMTWKGSMPFGKKKEKKKQ